jgi:predicted transcriptional regulator
LCSRLAKIAGGSMPTDVLGPLERKVMVRLWAAGPSTVAEVVAVLNEGSATPLAYTTVMTILARLFEKGFVGRAKDGRGFRYTAAADESELEAAAAKRDVRQLIERYGSSTVATFAADLAGADPELVRRLREMADTPEGGERR